MTQWNIERFIKKVDEGDLIVTTRTLHVKGVRVEMGQRDAPPVIWIIRIVYECEIEPKDSLTQWL